MGKLQSAYNWQINSRELLTRDRRKKTRTADPVTTSKADLWLACLIL